MNTYELIAFILYFVFVIGVGFYFFFKSHDKNEKDYFLGGRNMNGLVAAFSAGASDMSAWVLMGLPGAIYLSGLGQVWISIGLFIGTILAWIFIAPKLRRFAIKANDSITIPEFLANRFLSKNTVLRVSCAIIFVVGYCVYAASSISACGDVFKSIIPEANKVVIEIISAAVIVIYTFMGGFNAVCWTDFFQGMLMLIALMVVPIVALIILRVSGSVDGLQPITTAGYYNLFNCSTTTYGSIATIITGLGWGLGYFGMPHILVRYMSIKSEKEMKRSKIIGSVWTGIILVMATVVALVARQYFGQKTLENKNLVFIEMVHDIFKYGAFALLGGIFLSAIIAASMSTADSQLLLSSSALASDIYKSTFRKKASDKEILWVGRIAVIIILIIALMIALFGSQDIMQLVSSAWSIFGAAFGPTILLCLYWKRFNYKGACAGIIVGFISSILWMILFNFEYYGFNSVIYNTQIYEIVPGFILNLVISVVVALLTKAPSKEIVDLYNSVERTKD